MHLISRTNKHFRLCLHHLANLSPSGCQTPFHQVSEFLTRRGGCGWNQDPAPAPGWNHSELRGGKFGVSTREPHSGKPVSILCHGFLETKFEPASQRKIQGCFFTVLSIPNTSFPQNHEVMIPKKPSILRHPSVPPSPPSDSCHPSSPLFQGVSQI